MEFQPLRPTRPKALTLEDILAQFDAIDQVIFEPIQLEQHRDAPALLPPTFPATSCPFNYFTLFLHTTYSRLLQLIQINTRQCRGYTHVKRDLNYSKCSSRV
jgi:hypothetical protein